ncbi:MAG: hypothetical protein AAF804_07980 [Bacteroidota bacterium]
MNSTTPPNFRQILIRLGFIAVLGVAFFQSIERNFDWKSFGFPIDEAKHTLQWFGQSPTERVQHQLDQQYELFCLDTYPKKEVYCVRAQPHRMSGGGSGLKELVYRDTFLVAHLPFDRPCPNQIADLPRQTQQILERIQAE